MTTRIKAAELHQRVGDVLAQIRYTSERVIIERRGKPVAQLSRWRTWSDCKLARTKRVRPANIASARAKNNWQLWNARLP